MIEIKNLSKFYDMKKEAEVRALQDVSLTKAFAYNLCSKYFYSDSRKYDPNNKTLEKKAGRNIERLIMKAKRYFILIFNLIFLFICFCTLAGCNPIEESEDYVELDGWMGLKLADKYITLFGVKGAARESEEIIVPTEIEGFEVYRISSNKYRSYFYNWKVKKIFITKKYFFSCNQLWIPQDAVLVFICTDTDIYIEGFDTGVNNDSGYPYGGKIIYVPKICIEDYKERYTYLNPAKFRSANFSYFYNFDSAPNEGYFWIDNIEKNESIKTIPTDPIREGYEFSGWYTEAQCINACNFDTFIKSTGEVNIYAKWVEK